MMRQTCAAVILGGSVTLFGHAVAGPAKPASFDGAWSVLLVTDAGTCERTSSYSLGIQDGRVRHIPTAGDAPVNIAGQIASDGSVSIGVQRGPARADAYGKLSAVSGSGAWNLPLLGCSGRWTAQRRSGAVAGL